MTIKGGCLCGKVRYEVNEPLVAAENCHCSMCRRQHGAAFATYADFKPGSFKWTAGEDFVTVYSASSTFGWCFCRECGSTLAGSEAGEVNCITLGTIEGDPGIEPSSHIYVGSKAQWHHIKDDLPQHDERA